MSNVPFVIDIVPVAGASAAASVAVNVPLMRVAVKLVIVTDPLPPATDEENEPAGCDPLIRLSVIVRDVAAFNANVPTLFAVMPASVIDNPRVLFVPTMLRIPVFDAE